MFNSREKRLKRVKQAFVFLKDNFLNKIDKNNKLIEFTSSSQAINKTSIILNLARELVKDGNKVLMIDMDLRNPLLSKISKVEFSRGFSDILLKDMPYENIITTDLYQKDLDLILSGSTLKDVDSYLDIPRLRNVLGSMREKYDYVLIDTPSNEDVIDANIISSAVDTVIIITNEKDKKKGKLGYTISQLEEVDAEISGLIMTDCK